MDGVFYLAIISGLKIEMELEMESADPMKTVVRVGRLSVVSSVTAGAQTDMEQETVRISPS